MGISKIVLPHMEWKLECWYKFGTHFLCGSPMWSGDYGKSLCSPQIDNYWDCGENFHLRGSYYLALLFIEAIPVTEECNMILKLKILTSSMISKKHFNADGSVRNIP